MIIATRISFVSKEMNGLETIFLHMLQTIPFVPSDRKGVDGDLTSDGELHSHVGKLLHQCFPKLFSDSVFLVVFGKFDSLFLRATSADRTDVDQSVSEFDEITSFAR